ncbi:MAG TPA: hypothetical protein PLM76_05140 [Tenuifilaceae bacterium]|nr:hypothetical protein [Tenuifilaceae bacterium]
MEKNQNEIRKYIISNILNGSDEQVISIITELKSNNDLHFIPALIDVLLSKRSEILQKTIVEYFSDIKNAELVPILVEHVTNSFPEKNVSMLVTACWQSRLDFSKHLNTFFSILINGSYQTAFEAFTVIENSVDSLTVSEIDGYISQVKKGIVKTNRDKQLLLLEMVSMLEKAKREIQ